MVAGTVIQDQKGHKMIIDHDTVKQAARRRTLRASIGLLFVISTAWLGYRWQKTDSEWYGRIKSNTATLSNKYVGAILLFESDNLPQIIVKTLDLFELPVETKVIGIRKDGSFEAITSRDETVFIRPFGWFMPNNIGVVMAREDDTTTTTRLTKAGNSIYTPASRTNNTINAQIPNDFDIAYVTNDLFDINASVFSIAGEKLVITDKILGEPISPILEKLVPPLNPKRIIQKLEDGTITTEYILPKLEEIDTYEEIIGGKDVSIFGRQHPVYVFADDGNEIERFYIATSKKLVEMLLSTTAWPNTLCNEKVSFAFNLNNSQMVEENPIYLIRTVRGLKLCEAYATMQ